MRIFYATDIHGSEVCFRKFVNAGKHYGADVVICGGDITGKMLVPIVKQAGGIFSAVYFDRKVVAESEEELAELKRQIRNSGFYFSMMDQDEFESLDQEKIDNIFEREMLNTLRQWMELAEERLKGKGIECFVMPGNDDIYAIDEVLDASDYVRNAEGKVLEFGNLEMLTLGYSNITPWNCTRDIEEEDFHQKIEELVSQVEHINRCIFNIHCPPYDSQLDSAPQLDSNFRPKLEGGELRMVPCGSSAVRKAIERHQPLLSLHGHIHEGKGFCKIGKTLVINPGSEYQQNILRGAVIDIEKKGKIKWVLTEG